MTSLKISQLTGASTPLTGAEEIPIVQSGNNRKATAAQLRSSSTVISTAIAGAASAPPLSLTGTWFTGGTSTTTKPQLLIEPTGTTSTAWSTSGTGLGVNAPSGFTGNLLDLKVGGATKLFVGSVGTSPTSPAIGLSTTSIWEPFSNAIAFGGSSSGPGLHVEGQLGSGFINSASLWWTVSGASGAYSLRDVVLARDAANTLAQRNGVNAQAFRLYNTFTDASNYERAFLRWNSNVFEVGPEAAGTGTTRPMRITAATLKLPNLPTYADNAAATSGGLVAGDVYKTATGELRITV